MYVAMYILFYLKEEWSFASASLLGLRNLFLGELYLHMYGELLGVMCKWNNGNATSNTVIACLFY
jgi:hypothetical protein